MNDASGARSELAESDVVSRLAERGVIAGAPREELEWLVARGSLRHYPVGEILARTGKAVDGFYIMLAGKISQYADHGGGLRRIFEYHAGDALGQLPYSRMVLSPGDSVVEEPADVLFVDREQFVALRSQCPGITTAFVHLMLDRARVFNASALHDEKMLSLGRLAAGLAHELNNPASAAKRSAHLLSEAHSASDEAARALGGAGLSRDEDAALRRAHERAITPSNPVTTGAAVLAISPLDRADREDAVRDWLERHSVSADLAVPLAETQVDLATLDELAKAVRGAALGAALRWLAADVTVRALAHDVERAAARIYGLVSAVKGFTYLDQAPEPGDVDIAVGLADTIAVLTAKAREKELTVSVHAASDLPQVRGLGGELNQVWFNLIENAMDAAPHSGHVDVTSIVEGHWVLISVTDDGGGIPTDVRGRIFDPFFTTKAVGKGTGLGLDIAQRLVRRHGGEIAVSSAPGRTVFTVRLPMA